MITENGEGPGEVFWLQSVAALSRARSDALSCARLQSLPPSSRYHHDAETDIEGQGEGSSSRSRSRSRSRQELMQLDEEIPI